MDAERIGAIGICGGGAYTVNAAITGHRIKSLVSITGVNFGRLIRKGLSQFHQLGALKAMAAQRTAEAQGTARHVIDYLPESVEAGKQAGMTEIDVLEATDYYKSARGRQPNGATSGLLSFNSVALAWDAFAHAETLLIQPLLVVIGDKPGAFGAYGDGWKIYGRAASVAKQIFVAEGWSHYDLYDKPEPVALAMAQVVPFFREYL